MKNKFFGVIAISVIALIAFLNVNIGLDTTNKKVDITLTKVEALAHEWEWNNIFDWWDYGFRADEQTSEADCARTGLSVEGHANVDASGAYSGGSGFFSGSWDFGFSASITTVTNGKKKTCETGGNKNCDSCECC